MTTSTEDTAEVARCRPFSIGDMCVVVAASAFSVLAGQAWIPFLKRVFHSYPIGQFTSVSTAWNFLKTRPEIALGLPLFGGLVAMSFVFIWSIAYAVMRLRKPRPPLGHLITQPGVAAFLALGVGIGLMLIDTLLKTPRLLGSLALAGAVPMTGAVLALRGRWRPEPGWIDRFGRVLGVCWCLLLPLYLGLVEFLIR